MEFQEVINKSGDTTSVWHHFLRNKDKSNAKCKICQKILKSSGGSTSSLQKHLTKIHNIKLEASASTSNLTVVPIKKKKITDFYESDSSMEVRISRMVSVDGISLRTFVKSWDLRFLFEKNSQKLPASADTIRNIILRECLKTKQNVKNEIKAILSTGSFRRMDVQSQ